MSPTLSYIRTKNRRHTLSYLPFSERDPCSTTRVTTQSRYSQYQRETRHSPTPIITSLEDWHDSSGNKLQKIPQSNRTSHSDESYFSCQTQGDPAHRSWWTCHTRRHTTQSETTLFSAPFTPTPLYNKSTKRPATFDVHPTKGYQSIAVGHYDTTGPFNQLSPPTTNFMGLSIFRHTIATISSLTSTCTNIRDRSSYPPAFIPTCYPQDIEHFPQMSDVWVSMPPMPLPIPVFHTQSILFLFGFICFPCWWVAAFLLEVEKIKKEKQPTDAYTTLRPPNVLVVHPSMIANGRTTSRVLWMEDPKEIYRPGMMRSGSGSVMGSGVGGSSTTLVSSPWKGNEFSKKKEIWQMAYMREKRMFQRWNRIMSFLSMALVATVVAMLVWYEAGIQYKWWTPVQLLS
ncbi:hypothetical protein BDF14DRAFT_1789986 [Spinellus fusiger]|nr:hypothetical protein BDF14DRAFT_1789986 [Spinellus fusiger]